MLRSCWIRMRRRSRAVLAVFLLRWLRKSKIPMASASKQLGEETLALHRGIAQRNVLSEDAADRVRVGLAGVRDIVENHRHAGIRALQHFRRLRDHADNLQPEDVL